jgi:hypothetical protein
MNTLTQTKIPPLQLIIIASILWITMPITTAHASPTDVAYTSLMNSTEQDCSCGACETPPLQPVDKPR